jgi:hypothetical protein
VAEFSLPETGNPASFNPGETALRQRWQTGSLRDQVRRAGMPAIVELCDSCTMSDRYGPAEPSTVGAALTAIRIPDARSAIGS